MYNKILDKLYWYLDAQTNGISVKTGMVGMENIMAIDQKAQIISWLILFFFFSLSSFLFFFFFGLAVAGSCWRGCLGGHSSSHPVVSFMVTTFPVFVFLFTSKEWRGLMPSAAQACRTCCGWHSLWLLWFGFIWATENIRCNFRESTALILRVAR